VENASTPKPVPKRALAFIGARVINRHSGRIRIVTDVRWEGDHKRLERLRRAGFEKPGNEPERLVVELDQRIIVRAEQFERNWVAA